MSFPVFALMPEKAAAKTEKEPRIVSVLFHMDALPRLKLQHKESPLLAFSRFWTKPPVIILIELITFTITKKFFAFAPPPDLSAFCFLLLKNPDSLKRSPIQVLCRARVFLWDIPAKNAFTLSAGVSYNNFKIFFICVF